MTEPRVGYTPVYNLPYAQGSDFAKEYPTIDEPRTLQLETLIAELLPAGAILAWAGTDAPPGWQLCNGTLLSRATHARLFEAIGVRYGIGDGVSTFATPNLLGRVVVASGGGFSLSATGGAINHTLTEAEIPSHRHTLGPPDYANANWQMGYYDAAPYEAYVGNSAAPRQTNYTGGGAAHNNMPPYLVLNYIIKL